MNTAAASNLDAAIALKKRGFCAHAVYSKGFKKRSGQIATGKEPIGKEWGLAQWDEKRLRGVFQYDPGAGVGIALGPGRAPNGDWLSDLEGDGLEAAGSLEMLLGGEVVETIGWLSTRGGHNLFTVDGERFLTLLQAAGAKEGKGDKVGVWHLDELPGLEFRIGGFKPDGVVKQVQSVCPPTVGDDEKRRVWTGGQEIAALPETAYQFLAAIADRNRMVAEVEALNEPAVAVGAHENSRNGYAGFKLRVPKSSRERYGQVALEREIEAFSNTQYPGRHAYLLRATCKLAGLVNAGALSEGEVLAGLRAAAQSNGMGEARFHEVDEAWRSALAMVKPRANIPTGKGGSTKTGNQGVAGDRIDYTALTEAELGVEWAADIDDEPVEWINELRLGAGKLHITAGAGGLGKSQYAIAEAATISTGGKFPDGGLCLRQGRVLILAAEDGRRDTVKPRLFAAGADMANVAVMKTTLTIKTKDGKTLIDLINFQNLDYWAALFAKIKPVLLIADPIPAFMGSNVNDHRNADVRRVLEPFVDLLGRCSVAMEAITHVGKSTEGKSATDQILGSVAYGNLARRVNIHWIDPDTADRYIVTNPKLTLGKRQPAIGYTIEGFAYEKGGKTIATSRLKFEPTTFEADENELKRSQKDASRGRRGPEPLRLNELTRFVFEFLRGKEPTFLSEISQAAGDAGLLGKQVFNEKSQRVEWTMFTKLYEVIKRIPDLPPPDDGYVIVTPSQDPTLKSFRGHARWQLRRADSIY